MGEARVSRVSGNLVIVCLALVAVVVLALLFVLIILDKPTDVWLPMIPPTVLISIGYIGNLLKTSEVASDVQQVRVQTNGNTERLIAAIERQAAYLALTTPPAPPESPSLPPVTGD